MCRLSQAVKNQRMFASTKTKNAFVADCKVLQSKKPTKALQIPIFETHVTSFLATRRSVISSMSLRACWGCRSVAATAIMEL